MCTSVEAVLRASNFFLRLDQWTTRQGRNLCIVLYVFSSKFRLENDARNETFKKQLQNEILTFLVGIVLHWLRKIRISRSQEEPNST